MFTNNTDQSQGIYIPNYPPPPLPFTQSHNSCLNSRIETFKGRFEHFLASRPTNNRNAPDVDAALATKSVKLCDVVNEVRQCYELIDEIKVESASLLNEAICLSESEWNEKMTMLRSQRGRMMQFTHKYSDPDVQAAIETKLKRRQEKRERIRKRKKETSALRQLRIEIRNEKHRTIDEWFRETAQAIETQRLRTIEEQQIEQILSDVKQMKSKAAKNINLMESLIELHRVRRIQKSWSERCEHELVDELASLKSQWQLALASYEEEEQKLRKRMKSNDLCGEWQEVLFSASEGIQPDEVTSIQDVNDLIRIRSMWDAFVVTPASVSGSSIPIGWITPKEDPLEEWKAFKISK